MINYNHIIDPIYNDIKKSINKMNYKRIYDYISNDKYKYYFISYIEYNKSRLSSNTIKNLLIFVKLIDIIKNKSLHEQSNIISKIFNNLAEKSKLYGNIDDQYNYYKKKIIYIKKLINFNIELIREIKKINPLLEILNKKRKIKYNSLSIEQKREIRNKKKQNLINKLGIDGYNNRCRKYYKKWYASLSKEQRRNIYLRKYNKIRVNKTQLNKI